MRLCMLSVIFATIMVAGSSTKCGTPDYSTGGTAQTLQVPDQNLTPEEEGCKYNITAPADKLVQLTINPINIGSEENPCKEPFITITSQLGPVTTELLRFCGNNPPSPITSIGTSAVLTIHGNTGVNSHAITAQYEAVQDTVCGTMELQAEAASDGQLNRPLNTMTDLRTCVYIITAPEEHLVQLTFEPSTVGSANGQCVVPYVKLESFDGTNTEPLASLCGSLPVTPYISKGKTVILTLFGSTEINKDAVKAKFKAIPSNRCGPPTPTIDPNVEWKAPAHKLIEGDKCEYTLTAKDGEHVEITFTHFEVGNSETECQTPYVKLEDMQSSEPKLIAKLCGKDLKQTFKSESKTMKITVDGNAAVNAESIKATIKSVANTPTEPEVDKICGKTDLQSTYAPSEKWSAPAADMTDGKVCTYTISAEEGDKIEFQVEKMNVGKEASPCVKPYVKFEQDDGSTKKQISEACGEKAAFTVVAEGKKLYITITGDTSVKQNAISAIFKSAGHHLEYSLMRILFLTILVFQTNHMFQ